MTSVAQTYSEWQKRPVPTFRPGAKSSIQECIDKAPPFSRVIVLGGIYNEQLNITKPIEIIGEDGEDPVVSHKGPVVQVHNDVECYIQRLNIQAKSINRGGGAASSVSAIHYNLGAGAAASNKDAPAVLIGGQSKPIFKNCEITSVMVTSTADPQFVHCHIGKNQNGPCISVRDHASGTYMQCKFRDCGTYCVEVCSRGEPKFVDNTIEADGKDPVTAGAGLCHVHGGKDVRPVFQANRFEDLIDANSVARYVNTALYGSRRTAVVVDGFAEPVFEDNMFVGSEICVTLRACGGVFRNNTVTTARSCGVYIRAGCAMKLQENKIQGNATYGVVLDGCDAAHLDGNHISNNSHVGCLVLHSGNFHMVNNHFVSNAGGGLCLWEQCRGVISECDFRMNQRYGAYFYGTDCQVLFKQNRLIHNSPAGILCENGCTPQISLCEVAHSPVAGVWITTSAAPALSKCTVSDCERYGVIVTANGRGTLVKNTIRGGREAALFVTDGANPTVTENDIAEGSLACVLVSEGGVGTFTGNRVRNSAFGVVVRLFADPVFVANTIVNCGEGGIVSEEEGIGTFVDNTIEKCASGFLCGRGGEAAFRNNTVKECTAAGAMLKGGSRAVLEKNTFDANAVGIQIRGEDARSVVRRNLVTNSTTYGICTADKGAGDVSENHVLLSGAAGLASLDGGASYFFKNRCTQDRGHGILCRKGGASKFFDNAIEFACGSGALVDQGGRPDISKCRFVGCKGYGLEIATGAEGAVTDCDVSECEIGFKGHGPSCKTAVSDVRFSANKELGALLVDNAECTLTKCTFSNHPKIALAVRNSGASLLEQCSFVDNKMDVESTLAGSLTTLRKCKLTSSRAEKASVAGGGASKKEDAAAASASSFASASASSSCPCDIHVDYHAGGDLRLEDCVIQDGNVGVRFRDRGKGLVRNTRIVGVGGGAGLLFDHLAMGSVQSCHVADCAVGCTSRGESKGIVTETVFDGNACNVELLEKAATEFQRCEMRYATQRPGIECAKSLGAFASCQIHHNGHGGVRVAGARTRTSFAECAISQNGDFGVEGSERCESGFVGCTIEENGGPGVIFAFHAGMHFTERNVVRKNGYFGVLCEDGSDGLFASGTIDKHALTANVKLDPGAQTRFERNGISDGRVGVINEGSACTLSLNKIRGNKLCAVQCFGRSSAVFENNEIAENVGGAVTFGRVFELPRDPSLAGNSNNSGSTRHKPLQQSSSTTGSPLLSPTAAGGGGDAPFSPTEGRLQRAASRRLAQEGISTAAGGLVARTVNRRSTITAASANAAAAAVAAAAASSSSSPPNLTLDASVLDSNMSLRDIVAETARAVEQQARQEQERDERERASWPYERQRRPDAQAPVVNVPACATFRNNAFSKNGLVGAVRLAPFSAGIFNQNTFTEERRAVVVEDDARGVVEENVFTANELAVAITGPTASTTVAHNSFKRNGVCFEIGAMRMPQFSISENICEDSTSAAVVVGSGAQGTLSQFEFKGGSCGVRIGGQAEITIAECVFSGCTDAGVIVEGLSKPTIHRCRFERGCHVGAKLLECEATVSCCVFVGAQLAGLSLESPACSAKVNRCLFTQNAATPETVGVLLKNRTSGEIAFCDFHENSYGIRCEDSAEGLVTQCLVHRQANGGVMCSSGASTRFRKTSFAQNSNCDIVSHSSARPDIQRCLFRGDAACAFKCTGGGGTLADSAFRGYSEAAVQLIVGQAASVSRCFFTACDAAMMSTGKAPAHSCDFVSNIVKECKHGVRIHLGAGVSVNNNIISGCELVGIEVRQLGTGCSIQHNHVFKCGDRGIRVFDMLPPLLLASTTIGNNIVTDFGTGIGIDVSAGGGGEAAIDRTFVIQENYVANCRHGLVVGEGSPRVLRNQVQLCDHGMTIQRACSGLFEGNVTHSCSRVGTLIYSATAEVQRNHFCASGESGALEVKNDPSGNNSSRQGGNVRNNEVKNSYVPHWAAKGPDLPVAEQLVSVSDVKLSKEEQAAMNVLRKMYQEEELFPGPECLCDLVAPISPAARDFSRVSLLARPRGKSSASNMLDGLKIADALASMVGGESNGSGGPASPASGSMRIKMTANRVRNSVRLARPAPKRDESATTGDDEPHHQQQPASPSGNRNASLRRQQSTRVPPGGGITSPTNRRQSTVGGASSPTANNSRARGNSTRSNSTVNKPRRPADAAANAAAAATGGTEEPLNLTENFEEPRMEESVAVQSSSRNNNAGGGSDPLEFGSRRDSGATTQPSLRSGSSESVRSGGEARPKSVRIVEEGGDDNRAAAVPPAATSVVGAQIASEHHEEEEQYDEEEEEPSAYVDDGDNAAMAASAAGGNSSSINNNSPTRRAPLPVSPRSTAEERARERQTRMDRANAAKAEKLERQRLIEQQNKHLAFVKLDADASADASARSSTMNSPSGAKRSSAIQHRVVLGFDAQIEASQSMDQSRILAALAAEAAAKQHPNGLGAGYEPPALNEQQRQLQRYIQRQQQAQEELRRQIADHQAQQQREGEQSVGPGTAIYALQVASSPDAVIRARIRDSQSSVVRRNGGAAGAIPAFRPEHLLYAGRDAVRSTEQSTEQLLGTIHAPPKSHIADAHHREEQRRVTDYELHAQLVAAYGAGGSNPHENRLGKDDAVRERDAHALDGIVPVEEEPDEAPLVPEAFRIQSLSKAAGIASPDGVPVLPHLDRVNWVSPTAGEKDDDHDNNDNSRAADDPDTETSPRRNNGPMSEVPGLFSYSTRERKHRGDRSAAQNDDNDNHNIGGGGDGRFIYLTEAQLQERLARMQQQQEDQNALRSPHTQQLLQHPTMPPSSAPANHYNKAARLLQKVASYDKSIGSVFSSPLTTAAASTAVAGGGAHVTGFGGQRGASPTIPDRRSSPLVLGGPHTARTAGVALFQQQDAAAAATPPATVRHWSSASAAPFSRHHKAAAATAAETPLQRSSSPAKNAKQLREEQEERNQRMHQQLLRIGDVAAAAAGGDDHQERRPSPYNRAALLAAAPSAKRQDTKQITRALQAISGAQDGGGGAELTDALAEAASSTVHRYVVQVDGTAVLVPSAAAGGGSREQQRQQQESNRQAVQQLLAAATRSTSPPTSAATGAQTNASRFAGLRIGNFGNAASATGGNTTNGSSAGNGGGGQLPPIRTAVSSPRINNSNASAMSSSANNSSPQSPREMTPRELARHAAQLQAKSDIRRSDLMHSTTAQMFAAFDRRAGALGKIQ